MIGDAESVGTGAEEPVLRNESACFLPYEETAGSGFNGEFFVCEQLIQIGERGLNLLEIGVVGKGGQQQQTAAADSDGGDEQFEGAEWLMDTVCIVFVCDCQIDEENEDHGGGSEKCGHGVGEDHGEEK